MVLYAVLRRSHTQVPAGVRVSRWSAQAERFNHHIPTTPALHSKHRPFSLPVAPLRHRLHRTAANVATTRRSSIDIYRYERTHPARSFGEVYVENGTDRGDPLKMGHRQRTTHILPGDGADRWSVALTKPRCGGHTSVVIPRRSWRSPNGSGNHYNFLSHRQTRIQSGTSSSTQTKLRQHKS